MNPYKAVEKTARIIGWVVLTALLGGVFFILALVSAESWGWWAILWIFLIVLGVAALGFFFGIVTMLVGIISRKWRNAAYEWENRNRGTR